jgi:peptidoglycan/xylan/chitin deacetylase (PgdA/CDA1 family)
MNRAKIIERDWHRGKPMDQEKRKIVLMYHGVIKDESERPPDREEGAGFYDIPVAAFREQMQQITLLTSDLVREDVGFSVGGHIPILTFDDGELNNFRHVFPILKEFGFTGYFFITTSRIGRPGYIDLHELQIMNTSGMTIGSHGVTHRILTALSAEELDRELRQSKELLEQITHKPVASFSVPRGFYDKRVLAKARSVGYTEIFVSGAAPRREEGVFGRTAVRADWDIARFELALQGRTPWEERVLDFFKNCVKGSLGPQVYDVVRRETLKRQRKGRPW